jgi:hypothetical protein
MVARYCLILGYDVDLNRKKFVDVIMNLKLQCMCVYWNTFGNPSQSVK